MKKYRWGICAALLFFPFTAVLHHAVFHRPTCILNNFGHDYTFEVISLWLRNDPSPYLGGVLAVLAWYIGRRWSVIQPWAIAFLLSFLPLSLWIWDIPFTERIICMAFHDGRALIHSRHLYILGAALTPLLFLLLRKRQWPATS